MSSVTIPSPRAEGRFRTPKRLLRTVFPLGLRLAIARFLSGRHWVAASNWWAYEMLRDLAENDPNAYHRFLWANHLAYADTYEVGIRFQGDAIHATRRMLFDDLVRCLAEREMDPSGVSSIFEVGCSLGYNLHFLERSVFTRATVLDGCDIDAYAIEQGCAYLASIGSRVHLFTADMAELSNRLDDKQYDLMLCAGVLMYLRRADAERVVSDILRHTNGVAAFAGLADPDRDNATLADSRVRERDGTFVHNIDAMVARAGGRVVQRRWEGPRSVDGNTIYFVFAQRAQV